MAFKDLPNDSITKTLVVATTLCLVCSIAVATAAVMLRPMQEANKKLDLQKNIIAVAGIDTEGLSVQEAFASFEPRLVDLGTGRFSEELDPGDYDQRAAAKDPAMASPIPKEDDIADVRMRERLATVYLTRDDKGEIERIILPVRGYGLWSTLWGFLALEGDGNTVIGISFYEHAETPGLGGEVDNPGWKALWDDKVIYDDQGEVAIELAKGVIDHDSPLNRHKVDALSGATLTSNGVTNLLRYWMGENGFAPFLKNLREGNA